MFWMTCCSSFISRPHLSYETFTPSIEIHSQLDCHWTGLGRGGGVGWRRRKRKNNRAGPTMTSAGDVSYSVGHVMISQTWPLLPLCGHIKEVRPEDIDHTVIAKVGVSVQEAPWGHPETWFVKMFPHSCAVWRTQTYTYTWVNRAVGVSRQRWAETQQQMKQLVLNETGKACFGCFLFI